MQVMQQGVAVATMEVQLEAVVRRFIPKASVTGLCKLTGGASQQTWSFDAKSAEGVLPLILRQAQTWSTPQQESLPLALEAALIRRVGESGIPVPRVYSVLEPDDGLGDGFIMERVEGEALPPRLLNDPGFTDVLPLLARQCGEILGRMHQISVDAFPYLRRAPAKIELARQLADYRSHGIRRPVFELAFRWLQDHMPPHPGELVLVHGDFRNGNFMIGPKGVQTVLDWELAHLGDPMEDLGWMCVNSWRFGKIDLPVGGFGTREELFAGYESVSGIRIDPERVKYWEVYGTLKWGVICQSMAMSFKKGDERPLEPAVIGRRASEAEIDLMQLLAPRG